MDVASASSRFGVHLSTIYLQYVIFTVALKTVVLLLTANDI